jgi:thioredoxin-like negative regulator of GroEL
VPTATRTDLPRPAIIAALGVLVLAVTFLVTKAGTDTAALSLPKPAASQPTGTTSSTGTSTTTTPAKPKQPKLVAGPGLPSDVARALNADKVVVLFFYEPSASDDQATRAAIRAVRSAGGRVSLFQDTVAHISDYRRIVGTLGISQSPAMVVIDRRREARVFEGYLDSGSIRQTVRDAR